MATFGDERGGLAWVGDVVVRRQALRVGAAAAGTDLKAFGDAAPDGPILGARVEHEGARQALIADDPE